MQVLEGLKRYSITCCEMAKKVFIDQHKYAENNHFIKLLNTKLLSLSVFFTVQDIQTIIVLVFAISKQWGIQK